MALQGGSSKTLRQRAEAFFNDMPARYLVIYFHYILSGNIYLNGFLPQIFCRVYLGVLKVSFLFLPLKKGAETF